MLGRRQRHDCGRVIVEIWESVRRRSLFGSCAAYYAGSLVSQAACRHSLHPFLSDLLNLLGPLRLGFTVPTF